MLLLPHKKILNNMSITLNHNTQNNLESLISLDLLNHLQDGFLIASQSKKIIFFNKGAEEITNFKATEILETQCYKKQFQHLNNQGEILCNKDCPLNIAMRDNRVIESQYYIKNKENKLIQILSRISPIQDSEKNIIGAIEIFNNVENQNIDEVYKRLKEKLDEYRGILKQVFETNEKLQKKIIEISNTDILTGFLNRRYFNIEAQKEIERHQRYKHDLSLLIIDIDHFKKVNDRHGHLAGDYVLKTISSIMRRLTRSTDLLCRFGGEELIVLLPETMEDGALYTAEKIRTNIEAYKFKFNGKQMKITASIGIKTKDCNEAITLDEFIDTADKALYQAKKEGRNRVIIK